MKYTKKGNTKLQKPTEREEENPPKSDSRLSENISLNPRLWGLFSYLHFYCIFTYTEKEKNVFSIVLWSDSFVYFV